MKKTLLALTLALSAAIISPAFADEEEEVTRRTTETKDGQEYICEYRKRTGSNLTSKICTTKEDAAVDEQAARDDLQKGFERGFNYQQGN